MQHKNKLRCNLNLLSKQFPKKVFWLVDNATCHPKTNEMQSDGGMITVMCLLANCTAVSQPIDRNIISLTKLYYKETLSSHLNLKGLIKKSKKKVPYTLFVSLGMF